MEQLGNEIKKIIKAGMGAVASGLEMGQEAIETLAQKGEPIYQQAKSAVSDAAGKVAQAVNEGIQSIKNGPDVTDVIDVLRTMSRSDWAQVRAALDEFEAQADEIDKAAQEAAEAAQKILDAEEACCPASEDEAPAEKAPEEKTADAPDTTDGPQE